MANEVWKTLEKMGAILRDDHFVYTKGGHGSEYVNKDALFKHPDALKVLCKHIADAFKDHDIEVVLGPAIGGALIAQWVAFLLPQMTGRPLVTIYADKEDGGFVLKRGYDAEVPGKKVLVVEDILNTGGTVKQIVELAREHGGTVTAVGAICNRGNVRIADIGHPPKLYSVVSVSMNVYDAGVCPLCAAGKPINTKIGKGAEYVAKHGQPARA